MSGAWLIPVDLFCEFARIPALVVLGTSTVFSPDKRPTSVKNLL